MSRPRRRRDGFDYFVDRYENSYYDNEYNNNYDDYQINNNGYGNNDQLKRNRYTGEIQVQNPYPYNANQYNNPYLNHQNTNQINYHNVPLNNYGTGTLEFSAIPGQGGLNPNERPLGDQTMMFSATQLPARQQANNINAGQYITQMLKTQQIQLDQQKEELGQRIDDVGFAMNSLSKKMDDVIKSVDSSTKTLNLRQNELMDNIRQSQEILVKNTTKKGKKAVVETKEQNILDSNFPHTPEINKQDKKEAKNKDVTKSSNKNNWLVALIIIFISLSAIASIVVGVLMFLNII